MSEAKLGALIPSKPKRGKREVSTVKAKAFAKAFASDPRSSTFGNATQSALAVAPHLTTGSAAVQGHNYLKSSKVVNEVERVLTAAGIGTEVRGQALSDIIHHSEVGRTVTTYDKESGRTVQDHGPSYTAIIKAIDTANKMSGLYQQQQAAADVMAKAALDALMDKFLPGGRSHSKTGGGGNGTSGGSV